MNARIFATKVAIPITEAWDFPAILFNGDEPTVINDAMYRLLSWSDARDTHFEAAPPVNGTSRLCGRVHRRNGVPKAVSFKCAAYRFPDSVWTAAVFDNSPESPLKLLLAAMAAHVDVYHGGDKSLELPPELAGEWTVEKDCEPKGYDARVLNEWHSLRDICDITERGWRLICKTPLRDKNMRVSGVVTVHEPLTGEKPEFVRVTQNLHMLENTLNHSPHILFTCKNEEDYPIEYISKNIGRYAVPEDVLLGRGNLADIFEPVERGGLFYEINKNYGAFADFTYEHSLTLRGGKKRFMKTVMRFTADNSGQIVSLEGQISDITEHHDLLEKLREIKRPLQEKLGDDLMENISPIGNEISLYDVMDINEAQELFAKTFGVSSAIVDLAGMPITKRISYSLADETCEFVNLACGGDVCADCFKGIAKMLTVSGHNEVLHCKATGLMMTASPVRIGERVVAAWVLCQMLTNDDCGRFLYQTGKRFGVEASPFIKMLAEVPKYSIADFERTRSTLDLVARQISMLATRNAQFFVQKDVEVQEKGHIKRLAEREALLFDCFSRLEMPEKTSAYDTLEFIARRLKFNRAYYYLAGDSYNLRYEWFDNEKLRLPRQLRRPPLSIFPEYSEQALEVYEASRIDILNQYSGLSGAKSAVHMPVFENGRLSGVLGLDECTGIRIFFDEDKKLLSAFLGTVTAILKKSESSRKIGAALKCAEDVRSIGM